MIGSSIRWLALPALMLGQLGQALAQPVTFQQLDRRERREPSIVLNPGGRTGTCDVLKFSPDGRFLLAAGDDKLVTVYPVIDEKQLDSDGVKYLRWPAWREQRGAIYAMDISADGKLVAVGGVGLLDSAVAVIDRESQKIVHFVDLRRTQENLYAVMALAFSPDGKQLAAGTGSGAICLWNFRDPPEIIGRHDTNRNGLFNRVRALMIDNDGAVHSLAEGGIVATWTKAGNAWNFKNTLDLEIKQPIRCAVFHPRQKLIAVGVKGDIVVVGDLQVGNKRRVALGKDQFPRSLAISPQADRLAVGVGVRVKVKDFFLEGDEQIAVFDINGDSLKEITRMKRSGRAEALAWLNGSRFAVAGGDNQEVALYDLSRREEALSVARGAGSGIWRVAVSDDARYLAFVDSRDPNANHPNRRGTDKWRFFDTKLRLFENARPQGVHFGEPIDNANGWTVQAKDASQWSASGPNDKTYPLPWDEDRDGRPTCYTFINPKNGPVRLAVGHYWGFSLFDLGPEGPKRVRLYSGHAGQVTSIASSADGTWLVTASEDQTISAWSLADWPSRNHFGAKFEIADGKVIAKQIDLGSPAWEMGLVEGDEIFKLAVRGKDFFIAGKLGDAEAAKAMLESPEPGIELVTAAKRAARDDPFNAVGTVRTRPLWRFFPGNNREWVLWMWQASFYITSTSGDSKVGWLMNHPTMRQEPIFYPLERFRKGFEKREVIDKLMNERNVAAALKVAMEKKLWPADLALTEPPNTRLENVPGTLTEPVMINLIAEPRGDHPDLMPVKVELWINDFRIDPWTTNEKPFNLPFKLEPKMLRSGLNRLVLQSFNRLGNRSESIRYVNNPNKAASQSLLGIAVGIDDYSRSEKTSDGSRNKLKNLTSAVNDARQQQEKWQQQKGWPYHQVEFRLLPDAKGKRASILEAIDELAREAQPDDMMILVFSGHGDILLATEHQQTDDAFVFCGPDYQQKTYAKTGIDNATLYEKLASIRCRKLVFLDACHSGEAAFNQVRALAPDGQGPVIMAACDRSEQAWEDPNLKNGLFTYAVLKTLGEGFKAADKNHDGALTAQELFDSVRAQMPALLRGAGKPEDLQNPIMFPPDPDNHPLIKR